MRALPQSRADALATVLDLDLDADGICHACLSFVSDLEGRAGRSAVARSIVPRLAEQLSHRARVEMRLEAHARKRLRLAPPELN